MNTFYLIFLVLVALLPYCAILHIGLVDTMKYKEEAKDWVNWFWISILFLIVTGITISGLMLAKLI